MRFLSAILLSVIAQTATGNTQIETVLDDLRLKIRPSVADLAQKRTALDLKYLGVCKTEEEKAKTAENHLGTLFWQVERKRCETAKPPLKSIDLIPKRCAAIRKAWYDQRKALTDSHEKIFGKATAEAIAKLLKLKTAETSSSKTIDWTIESIQNSPDYLEALANDSEKDFGLVVAGNVALGKNGVKVAAKHGAMEMVDGISQTSRNRAKMPLKQFIVLTFPTTLRLDRIRLDLMKLKSPRDSGRKYRFFVESSVDGKKWKRLIDRTKKPGGWAGWQDFSFRAQPIKALRIQGTFNNRGTYLLVTELEAFCPTLTKESL